jgi:uncharacterized lipoprotein YddW (UPF0748 family)/N-acetylmuramoyl-L-alanine amidase
MPKKRRLPPSLSALAALLALFCLIPILFSSCRRKELPVTSNPAEPSPVPSVEAGHLIDPDSELRGVWIASVWNLDYPSRTDLSADELRAELDEILSVMEENRLNAIFFQVRTAGDALYDSDLFPVSQALSTAGTLTFDPLRYLVETARPRNIRVFAWVNPLRATLLGTDVSALPAGHPAKEHPEWTVAYADGRLYFDAGLPEVRQFITDGVREIVMKYDVDGVAFDDYFYPYPVNGDDGRQADFGDDKTFRLYGGDFDDRGDWRRDNINRLVGLVHDTVRFIDPECVFGVSPYGVWQNSDGKNGGSDSRSFEAYKSLYCDAPAWIEAGSVDFLSPQIYWDFETDQAPFDTMVRWWNDRLDGTDIKLWVSHACYKYDEPDWPDPAGQLCQQITYARSERSYYGSILYGYDELKRNSRGASDDTKEAFEPEIIYSPTLSNGLGVTVSSPLPGTELDGASTYVMGMSDPYYPLTVDGRKVGRTKSGFFSFVVTLDPGENTFVFEQNGKKYVYTIWFGKKTSAVEETELSEADPDPDPAQEEEELTVLDRLAVTWSYPVTDVMTDEDILWVSCTAPAGSDVTADIGGLVTKLVPLSSPSKEKTEDGWVYISYGANAKLPEAPANYLWDCGPVRFTATHPDSDEPLTRDGIRVRTLGEHAGVPVRAKADYTSLKISRQSSYYSDYTVQSAGMTDLAVAQRDGFYLLRMGGFVAEGDVEELPLDRVDPADFASLFPEPPISEDAEDAPRGEEEPESAGSEPTETEAEPESVSEEEAESPAGPEAEPETESESEAEPETESEGEPETEAEPEPEPEEVITADLYGAMLPGRATVLSGETFNRGRVTEVVFRMDSDAAPPYNGTVEDGSFVLTFYSVNGTRSAAPSVSSNPLFDSVEILPFSDRVRYVFPLRDVLNFYGFDLEYRESGETVLILRNPYAADLKSDTPLDGIRIVLDAGHGGSDPGAFGPLRANSSLTDNASDAPGFSNSEKDINLALTLAAAEKLSSLGADVILTREEDVTFDTLSRAELLETLEPDLCLSLHQNSMGYSSDITKIRGTLGLFCEAGGQLLADCVGRSVASALYRNYRGTSWQALAMCRNPKFPQALIEVGFMTSVEEYETMTSEAGIERGAQGIADGVMMYFERMAEYAGQ